MEKEKVLEILISLILIVLIFMMVLIGVGHENKSTVISNSYNTYYNNPSNTAQVVKTTENSKNACCEKADATEKVYYIKEDTQPKYVQYVIPKEEHIYYEKIWDYDANHGCSRNHNSHFNYKDYSSWGNHVKKESFGLYSDSYEVHVKNNYREGKYFTVKFYFEDGYGRTKTYDVRKYIFSDSEEMFYFRDISKDVHTYSDWHYDVIDN